MCGIAGQINFNDRHDPPSIDLMKTMANTIRHRGPDEFGVYLDASAGLVSVRLAIIDLVSGQQPMSNDDESLWIVFNGEVFNYVELRHELQSLGYRFRTQSDTEVIVKAYEAWGEKCFARFNGQWAVAIWDPGEHRLALSRDPAGICPLFVHEENGRLWF